MDYKFLFIITSAIIPFRVGSAHSPEERFTQTLETIKSIRRKVPNALIWLTESSSEKLPEKYSDQLIKLTDFYIEHYNDEIIIQLYGNLDKVPDRFIAVKSLLETHSLYKVLVKLASLDLKINRVFKLSGRYFLNDKFNIQDYETKFLENKYVFKVYNLENDTNHPQGLLYGINGLVTTGLWSFDISLLNETIDLYQKCFSFMDIMMIYTTVGSGIDIEHSIYKFIDFSKVINNSILGVTRISGPDANIYDI